jgi:predicted nucleic acid-binding protein
MARYLLDTNHLGGALDDESALRERIYRSLGSGHRFGTCVPVLCELEVGIAQTRRREHNERILRTLLRRIRVWPLDVAIAPIYAETYQELRGRGRVLSQVDMLLAAMARSLDATLLTSDRDFEAVAGLRVDNWLT